MASRLFHGVKGGTVVCHPGRSRDCPSASGTTANGREMTAGALFLAASDNYLDHGDFGRMGIAASRASSSMAARTIHPSPRAACIAHSATAEISTTRSNDGRSCLTMAICIGPGLGTDDVRFRAVRPARRRAGELVNDLRGGIRAKRSDRRPRPATCRRRSSPSAESAGHHSGQDPFENSPSAIRSST